MKIVFPKHVMLVSHLSAQRAQCLKPLHYDENTIKHFFALALLYIFMQ